MDASATDAIHLAVLIVLVVSIIVILIYIFMWQPRRQSRRDSVRCKVLTDPRDIEDSMPMPVRLYGAVSNKVPEDLAQYAGGDNYIDEPWNEWHVRGFLFAKDVVDPRRPQLPLYARQNTYGQYRYATMVDDVWITLEELGEDWLGGDEPAVLIKGLNMEYYAHVYQRTFWRDLDY